MAVDTVTAWWGATVVLAAAAYARDEPFFQVQVPQWALRGPAGVPWTADDSGQDLRTYGRAAAVLAQLAAAGWHLEHASSVWVQVAQNSRDFVVSGQPAAGTGEVVGLFLFRRGDPRP